MKRWLIYIFLGCSFSMAMAHQADISTTMLLEKSDNNWVLQIRASLTAFQYEVKEEYGDDAYQTPEEFQNLVIQHVKSNLFILFNQQDTAIIQDAFVKLGHETQVVFTLSGVPETINSAYIKNSSFKDIHRNQSALMVLKKDFPKKHFVLNDANGHAASLIVNDSTFQVVLAEKARGTASSSLLIIGFMLVVAVGGGVHFFKSSRQKHVIQALN